MSRIQCDEIWSFCYAKEKNVPKDKQGQFGYSDLWTWVAMDAESKLVPLFMVGNRNAESAKTFIDNLASRLANRVQLTTDGNKVYPEADEGAFGCEIDYAMLVKMYELNQERPATLRQGVLDVTGLRSPAIPTANTFLLALLRSRTLTMRMGMRRFARLSTLLAR